VVPHDTAPRRSPTISSINPMARTGDGHRR
jgi:hypothetical protein